MEAPAASSSTGPCKRESALANRLLSFWTHGQLSAIQVQEIAKLAMLDGAEHEDLVALAKCGNHGQHPGNCHRDFMLAFCKDIAIADAHKVTVPCIDPKTNKEVQEEAAIFLPHMMHLARNSNAIVVSVFVDKLANMC